MKEKKTVDMTKEVARLQKKLARWYGEWVIEETPIEMFRDDPPHVYRAYLGGENKVRRLASRTNKLLTWYFNQYTNGVLNEGRYSAEDFALCARYARAVVEFEMAFAEAGQGGGMLEYNAVFYLSLNILAGWHTDATLVRKLLYKGLDTSLLDLRHNERHQAGKLFRHFWFLLHLHGKTDGLTLDTSPYSYPDDMSPYDAVLADWRTPDLDKVQDFVSALADFHMQEARDTEHGEVAEFDRNYLRLFPHEILTFLRLREEAGLANPESFDHPLMNQPLAKLPGPLPLPRPATPLLDQVIEKFRLDYPGSFTDFD